MKRQYLTIIGICCIVSCSPKETENKSDALSRDESKTERETEEEIDRKAIARANVREERVASSKAARAKLIGSQLESLELSNKRIYQKVVIRNITDVDISIAHDSGRATIRMTELTPQDQQRFHFDEEVAEGILKAQSAQALELASRPPALQSDAATSKKQAAAAARKVALLREEIAKEQNKLAEMRAGLVRLEMERQNVINEFNEEESNAQRIKRTRYDNIGGNDRIGGVNTSKVDRQLKIDMAAARISDGEALIRQTEARILSLMSKL